MQFSDYIGIACLVVFAISSLTTMIVTFLKTYNKNLDNKSQEALNAVLNTTDMLNDFAKSLFLYAQKQNWTNAERMDYCVAQILATFPETIRNILNQPVRDYVQKLYDSVTCNYKQLDEELAKNKTKEDTADKDKV